MLVISVLVTFFSEHYSAAVFRHRIAGNVDVRATFGLIAPDQPVFVARTLPGE